MFDPLEDIRAFLNSGGVVLWGILILTLILWTLIIERFWYIKMVYPARVTEMLKEWLDRSDHSSWAAHRIREAMISEANIELKEAVPTIRTLIAILPLVGLLGTVVGMIEVFDVVSFSGSSNARGMAAGVSRATIPTMSGLVVALSGVYFGTQFSAIVNRETQRLADALQLKDNQRQRPLRTKTKEPS